MADIKKEIEIMKNAVYGEDMKAAIYISIDMMNNQLNGAMEEIATKYPDQTALTESVTQVKEEINGFLIPLTNYDLIGIEFDRHGYINTSLNTVATDQWDISKPIHLEGNHRYLFRCLSGDSVATVIKSDANGNLQQMLIRGTSKWAMETYSFDAESDMYVVLCYNSGGFTALVKEKDSISKNGLASFLSRRGVQRQSGKEELAASSEYVLNSYYVEPNTLYKATAFGGWSAHPVVCRTATGEFISSFGISSTEPQNPSQAVQEIEFKTPANCWIVVLQASVNDGFASYEFGLKKAEKKPYENLTWVVCGDSLTEKNYRATTSYYDYIRADLGMDVINKGTSGNGYASNFMTQVSSMQDTDFDFMTIMGSLNDLFNNVHLSVNGKTWSQVLGNPTDTNATATMCGRINAVIDKFYELYPKKRLGIITPTPWAVFARNGKFIDGTLENGTEGVTNWNLGASADEYAKALVKICELRGIPCLDLYHHCGMTPWIESYKVEYYKENGVQDDGVHPNSKGHKIMAKIIEPWIEQFLIG